MGTRRSIPEEIPTFVLKDRAVVKCRVLSLEDKAQLTGGDYNTSYFSDFVFETNDGAASIRDNMQTLAPQLKVDANVIDSLSSVLNHEEKTLDMFKWKKKDGKYDEDKQYEAFSKTIESESQKDAELKEMKDLEMRKIFSRYLEELKHPKAKDLLSKNPTILRLKWGTKNNDTVCEVFLMMHMQRYKGENPKQWNLPFLTEDEGNTMDIIKMRVRFTTKMLNHEINIHKEKISEEAHEFSNQHTDKKLKEDLIMEAINKNKEGQSSQRV
ncbi:hypothetical protein Tco_1370441 [Tanacetum coccineum]